MFVAYFHVTDLLCACNCKQVYTYFTFEVWQLKKKDLGPLCFLLCLKQLIINHSKVFQNCETCTQP